MASDRHVFPDNHHVDHPAHQPHHRCDPMDRVDVTVWLSPYTSEILPESVEGSRVHPDRRKVLDFAKNHGLRLDTFHGDNGISFSGSVYYMERAFGVTLHHLNHPDGNLYRGHLEPVSIPADLKGIITGVFGLDERPVAKSHFRRAKPYHVTREIEAPGLGCGKATIRERASAPPGSFTPPQLAQLYNFPTGVTGSGQTIGIIELGGGFRPRDLQTYFQSIGVKLPTVTSVSVDGGRNAPTRDQDGPDGEVMLDIEVAGAVAPGAHITVYFAGNTDRAFMDAISRAIHDKVSVISISWGGAESQYTGAALRQFNAILAEAAAVNITVPVASGDSGSSDGVNDGKNHVDFPASSPYVLACGGTSLTASNGTITSEVVWDDGDQGGATGGGFSINFPRPSWQANDPGFVQNGNAGRGVPDVAGNADPNTGYQVLVDGQPTVVGGTSAVAPLWAGLVALLNQSLGRNVGFINPVLYAAPSALDDIVSGNNGAYQAGPGWDACCGLGSPNGANILAVLKEVTH